MIAARMSRPSSEHEHDRGSESESESGSGSASALRSSPRGAARRVVDVLVRAGHVAYFAGGCVRDELLGLVPKDYDVATDARPERVRRLFRRTEAVGEHFGVVLVRLRGQVVEVATFRTESGYSDRRRPDVVEFATAEEDASRRDFTINGLFLDPRDGDRIIDFIGGRRDLAAGIIRAIGTPRDRLAEDHLRALRAVRFAARFGFDIESATREAIARDASSLHGVSRERIGHEIRGMLVHPSRAEAVTWMDRLGLDGEVLEEEGRRIGETTALAGLPDDADVSAGLAAWAVDRGMSEPETADRWRAALLLSNRERDRLRAILTDLGEVRSSWFDRPMARRKRLAARSHFDDVLSILAAVDSDLGRRVREDVAHLSATPGGLAPPPLLDGRDLIALGAVPGPDFRPLLDDVYDAHLEGRVATRSDAESFIRDRLASSSS